MNTLDQWEADAKRAADTWKNILYKVERPKNPFRILALIDLVRKLSEPKNFDRIICEWSMLHGHGLKEEELNSLVDILAKEALALTEKLNG